MHYHPLVKKYFNKSELAKEYKLYSALISPKSLSEAKAETFINSTLEASLRLNKTALRKEKYNLMVLELNASDNRNIQVVRKIIKEFASCRTLFNSGYKLIILDEVDSMTNDAQFALRRIMETYSDNVRFCFICNYINQIITPITSRCVKFRFNAIDVEHMTKRLQYIATNENVNITKEALQRIRGTCCTACNSALWFVFKQGCYYDAFVCKHRRVCR